ncbi:hypothetical protein Pan216_20600 [Planctomycetes bacterium Pan216]|uniref:Uncharacterized protein n=1 Tax=Kolteria novifilia TaxID=2527975 RepID=A0A518B2P6_9BACT|nr:hypothetical protein Pan216_20600 [Planctomycetes bacterium Pan216]
MMIGHLGSEQSSACSLLVMLIGGSVWIKMRFSQYYLCAWAIVWGMILRALVRTPWHTESMVLFLPTVTFPFACLAMRMHRAFLLAPSTVTLLFLACLLGGDFARWTFAGSVAVVMIVGMSVSLAGTPDCWQRTAIFCGVIGVLFSVMSPPVYSGASNADWKTEVAWILLGDTGGLLFYGSLGVLAVCVPVELYCNQK